MNAWEREDLVQKLAQRVPNGSPGAFDQYVQDALERLVGVGACRFGVRVDESSPASVDACALAPPMARMIDHTALKPQTTEAEVEKLCEEARRYCFASVCINPCYVPLAAEALRNSQVAVCTVIGFPLGANRTPVKSAEVELAVREGAGEVDMVLNVGLLKSGKFNAVEEDIRAVVEAARPRTSRPSSSRRALVKVILETALLTDEEKVIACVLSQNAGADFVKTSTGFSTGGATASDIALMRRVVGEHMGVKASGGVRTREEAEAMIAHGATRIGASASVAILGGKEGESGY